MVVILNDANVNLDDGSNDDNKRMRQLTRSNKINIMLMTVTESTSL